MKNTNLGKIAVDVVTGYKGVVVSRIEYLSGCVQYGLAGKVRKDNTIPAVEYFDEDRLGFGENRGGPQRDRPR